MSSIRPRPPAPDPVPVTSGYDEGVITFFPAFRNFVVTRASVNERFVAALGTPTAGPAILGGVVVQCVAQVIGQEFEGNRIWYITNVGTRVWAGALTPNDSKPVPEPVVIKPMTVQRHQRIILMNYDVPATSNNPIFKGRMTQDVLDNALKRAREFPAIMADFSGGRIRIEQEIVVEERPVTRVDTYGGGWWVGRGGVPDQSRVGEFDSLITYLDAKVIPMHAGGLSYGGYSCINTSHVGPLADVHEWGHQVESAAVHQGYRQDDWGADTGPNDHPMLHSGSQHGYNDTNDWEKWNRDWFQAKLVVPAERRPYCSSLVGATWGVSDDILRSLPRKLDGFPGVKRSLTPSDRTMVGDNLLNPPARKTTDL